MRKVLFAFMILGAGYSSVAQEKSQSLSREVNSKEDLTTMAKKAVNRILTTPADTTDLGRREVESFLISWMEKTEDYSFNIDYSVGKIIQEDRREATVLMAAMAECLFNDKNQYGEKVKLAAMKRLIAYSKDPANRLNAGPELKKMMAADQKGQLKKYLSKTE